MLKPVFYSLILLFLSACNGDGVVINTHFSESKEIRKGVPVYYQDKAVGEVVSVDSNDNGTQVKMRLNSQQLKKIGNNAAVVVNSLKQGSPLEIYARGMGVDSDKQPAWKSGQEIQGLNSMFELGAWMVEDVLKVGTQSVNQYLKSFQDYLESERFQKDKQLVQSQISQVTETAKQALNTIQSEVGNTMNDLDGSEEDAAKAVEKLGEELAPVVRDLVANGSELAKQLDSFTQELGKSTTEGDTVTGRALLSSLLEMLEKLSQSVEEGADSSEPLTN